MLVLHHSIAATLPFLLNSVVSFISFHSKVYKRTTTNLEMDIASTNHHMLGKDLKEEKRFVPKIPNTKNALYAFLQDDELFLLGNDNVQYALQLHKDTGKVTFLHWGAPVSSLHPLPYDNLVSGGDEYSSIYSDYAIYGDGDDRESALKLSSMTTGISSFDFVYVSHEVVDGKLGEIGDTKMPCTYTENDDEAKTLVIKLMDTNVNLEICLFYTVFRNYNAIARHTEICNRGSETISIDRIASWSLDLPPSPHENGYRLLQLTGAWGREGQEVWNSIKQGTYVVGDMEGSQVHRSNPFIAVTDGNINEDTGIVFAFSFIYSGSFQTVIQMNQMGLLRVNMGLHPDMFKWKLESGESFLSPECVGVYSNNGIGSMSRDYHCLYRTRLARGQWRDRLRPILLNTWEPFGFDFTHDKLIELAKSGKAAGVELFVLDDGWFGSRNSDRSGLGDWFPNPKKLPSGLVGLANEVNHIGLDFGIWVEPESVNRDSDLYRSHPDWVVEVPDKKGVLMRNQLLLDLVNEDVQNHLIHVLTNLLANANISYVKWDHNRFISNPYSKTLPADRQSEFSHRYVLALYKIVNNITVSFPHILFESCAGGGGRFDPASLAYMPQSWGSDNTDADERVKIQWGYSHVYPLSMMGSHVSAVPNQQVQRETSWESRVSVSHFGTFGYELNLMEITQDEKEKSVVDSRIHKAIRHLVQYGAFYRLRNPNASNWPGWMCVSTDKGVEAIVFCYQRLMRTRETVPTFLLKGLDSKKQYAVVQLPTAQTKRKYSGDELMKRGMSVSFSHDFEGSLYYVREI